MVARKLGVGRFAFHFRARDPSQLVGARAIAGQRLRQRAMGDGGSIRAFGIEIIGEGEH